MYKHDKRMDVRKERQRNKCFVHVYHMLISQITCPREVLAAKKHFF